MVKHIHVNCCSSCSTGVSWFVSFVIGPSWPNEQFWWIP